MKTTTIGSYPKPSYLEIPDWFRNEDNSPKDWEKAWVLLGNKKDEVIKISDVKLNLPKEVTQAREYQYNLI